MNKKEIQGEKILLGLDVSTKTIGVSVFKENGELLELTHISPKAKPAPESKTEELFKKADLFSEFVDKYKKMGLDITYIAIEEPLLRSNNVNTVATLLRFNGMVSKICYEKFGVVPEYISTYEARKNAFPELMQPGSSKKIVLFGAYPKETDKKMVIWEKVSKREPKAKWLLDTKGQLKKENFDMSDAYTVALAYAHLNNLFE
jgi:Holliday junction resolvasome RuvABC endonuclease subunit